MFIDEDAPTAIRDVIFNVEATDEPPAIQKRYHPFTETEKAFLEAKTRMLLRKGFFEESTSDWCAGVI